MMPAWGPSEPLYDVREASWTLSAVAQAGGRTVTASRVVRVRQAVNNQTIGSIHVAGGWSVSLVIAVLGLVLLAIAALAVARIVRIKNRTAIHHG